MSSAEHAAAGYGVAPGSGASFIATVDALGYINSPASVDLVIYLDAQDSLPFVWVSDSATISAYGTPAGAIIGSCSAYSLLPFGEQNKWVCRVSTILMKPDRTYYWWLDFHRQDPGASVPAPRISGPFSFSLVRGQAEAPPTPHPPPEEDPHSGVSSKTVEAAPYLPSAERFDGRRSIKHVALTRLVYRTMRALRLPRQLALACWNEPDWASVVTAEGDEPTDGDSELLGFWLGRQPRWLHLAPPVCLDVQGLLSTKLPNGRRAGALATVIHETLHAYGVRNEAQTNCYAVQLVPVFGWALGLSQRRAAYLSTLARNFVRRHAPSGYWDPNRCRDGGAWDLLDSRNLGA